MAHLKSGFQGYLLLILLGPALWLQSKYVRRVTPRMPEAAGPRAGVTGVGPPISLLVVGDSAAAGVGVASQEEALCGQLLRRMGQHNTVRWQLMAKTGMDSPRLVRWLQETHASSFDIVIVSVGVNDATALRSPRKWLQWQHELAALIEKRFKPSLLIHSAMPPMHGFTALPQPLRWFMGRWTDNMNRLLARALPQDGKRVMLEPFRGAVRDHLAADGFHPGAKGYAVWADAFSEQILASRAPIEKTIGSQAP